MKTNFVYNSLSGIILVVINAVLQIITIPILLNYLGSKDYGVFALISTIGLFGYFINIGFNLSVLKFVGEQGPGVESDRDIILSFIGISVLTICIAGIIILLNSEVLTIILGLSQQYVNDGTIALLNAIVFTNGLLFVGQVLTAVLDATKKIYVSNYLQIAYIISNRLALVGVLYFGGRFEEIAFVYYVTSMIWFLSLGTAFFRFWNFTQISGFYTGGVVRARKHLSYGVKIYLTSITGFFYEPFFKILISRFIGINEVGYFDIAFKIKTLFWGVIEKGLYPMLPKIVSETEEENRRLIHWLSRKLLLFAIPIIVSLFFILDPLIRLWLGGDPDAIIFSVRVLIVIHMATASGIPIYIYLMMKGHPEKTFIIQLLNVVFSLIYFFALVPIYGYKGSIFAFVGAVSTSQILLMWWQKKILNSNILDGIADFGKVCGIAFSVGLVNIGISSVMQSQVLLIIVIGSVDLLLISGLLYSFSIVTLHDLRMIFGQQSFRYSAWTAGK